MRDIPSLISFQCFFFLRDKNHFHHEFFFLALIPQRITQESYKGMTEKYDINDTQKKKLFKIRIKNLLLQRLIPINNKQCSRAV